MKHGFIKTAAMTPKIRVADTEYNAKEICKGIEETCTNGAKIIVFPELCLTGYTCSDLFLRKFTQWSTTQWKNNDILKFAGIGWF